MEKAQNSHIGNTSKTFYLPGYFVFGNGRCIRHVVGWAHFCYKEQNALSKLSYCPNLSSNKGRSSVIESASKMIHLSGISVVKTVRYSPICVMGLFLAIISKNAYRNHNNCPKIMNKHDVKFSHWMCIQNNNFSCA